MGKKKSRREINKSQEIRDLLAKNPAAQPRQIVADLKERGITVSEGLVSNIKYLDSRKKLGGKGTGKRGRGRGRAAAATGGALSAGHLLQTKQLADQLGGIEEVRRALDTLEQLR